MADPTSFPNSFTFQSTTQYTTVQNSRAVASTIRRTGPLNVARLSESSHSSQRSSPQSILALASHRTSASAFTRYRRIHQLSRAYHPRRLLNEPNTLSTKCIDPIGLDVTAFIFEPR